MNSLPLPSHRLFVAALSEPDDAPPNRRPRPATSARPSRFDAIPSPRAEPTAAPAGTRQPWRLAATRS